MQLIIIFLLTLLILATSCSKNKAIEKEKKVAPVFLKQKEQIDVVQLEKIINYGFASAMMYRNCFSSQFNKTEIVNERYIFEVLQLKGNTFFEEYDYIIFLKCKEIKGLNFMIRTKGKKYYYCGCVSDNDIDVEVSNVPSEVKRYELTVHISNLTKDKLQTFVNVSDKMKTIENIRKQIRIIFEDMDLKTNQNFYIGPFSEFDLCIRIYWVEKKWFINLSRWSLDMELKEIHPGQYEIYEYYTEEQVENIKKYGELIVVEKSKKK